MSPSRAGRKRGSRPDRDRRTPTLRGRLVIVLVALAALGMTVAGLVVTAQLRTFLLDRVDAQLADAGDARSIVPRARGADWHRGAGRRSTPSAASPKRSACSSPTPAPTAPA